MNPNIKLIIFNGPPFSGKDTGVDAIFELPQLQGAENGIRARFKNVLYENTAQRYNLDLEQWVRICNDVTVKEQPQDYLDGKSPRQALIYESEEVIKKEHGELGVAVITANRLKDKIKDIEYPVIVFSDGGFNCEIKPLMEILGITRDQVLIFRCHADGCNFDNDSREWLDDYDHDVYNDKTIQYHNTIRKLTERFLANEYYIYHFDLMVKDLSSTCRGLEQTQKMVVIAKSPERAWQIFTEHYRSADTDKTFDVKMSYQITEVGMVTNRSVERNKVLIHELKTS